MPACTHIPKVPGSFLFRAILSSALGAFALVAVLATAACSQPTPTPLPTSTPWIVTATPGPTGTPWIVTPTPRPTERPTATPTSPARFIPATPSGPGICGRTPEVQQVLIETLKIASCRLITEHELYRIRELPDIRAPELRAGDFAGLVNLYDLEVDTGTVPSGTFAGSRIKHLRIGGDFEDGAFNGANLDSLSIGLAEGGAFYDRSGSLAGHRAPGRLPELPESLTWLSIRGDLRRLDWQVFQTLPELEYLSLAHDQERPEGTPAPAIIALPADAFASNPKLRGLELKSDDSWGVRTYRADASLLAEHEHLAHVVIDNLDIRRSQPDGLPLQIHPDSPAAAFVAEQGLRDWSDWEEGRDFRLSAATFPSR